MSIVNMVDFECKKDGGGGEVEMSPPATAASPVHQRPQQQQQQQGSQLNKAIAAEHKTNYVQTLMHLLNGFVGSGILVLPSTFRDGGLVLSLIVNPLIGLLSCLCIHRILSINRLLMNKANAPPLDYHELAEYTFLHGPARFRPWSGVARRAVLVALTATQIGGCCVYFVFIGSNVEQFLANIYGLNNSLSKTQCFLLILPFLIGVNWVRSLKQLSYLSALSNFLMVASLGIIYYFLFSESIPSLSRLPPVGKYIPESCVSTLFIYEGISVSMSLYRSIDQPTNFSKPFGVLNVGMLIITFFYCSLGIVGYARFGDQVADSITHHLPNTPLYNCVQIFYAIAVMFTYPIILYVPISIIWPILKRRVFTKILVDDDEKVVSDKDKNNNTAAHKDVELDEKTKKLLWRQKLTIQATNCVFRALLVLLTFFLATVIPKLDLIISLVGAVTSTSIAIMIPVALHTIAFWEECKGKSSRLRLLLENGAMFAVGLAGFILGTYYSIADIVTDYADGAIDEDTISNRTSLILEELPLILP